MLAFNTPSVVSPVRVGNQVDVELFVQNYSSVIRSPTVDSVILFGDNSLYLKIDKNYAQSASNISVDLLTVDKNAVALVYFFYPLNSYKTQRF